MDVGGVLGSLHEESLVKELLRLVRVVKVIGVICSFWYLRGLIRLFNELVNNIHCFDPIFHWLLLLKGAGC